MEDRTIPRQPVHVTVTLSDSRSITGKICIDLDSRLSDFMNQPGQFFVLRDKNDITRIINKAQVIEITGL
jgi:hypothetical protein